MDLIIQGAALVLHGKMDPFNPEIGSVGNAQYRSAEEDYG